MLTTRTCQAVLFAIALFVFSFSNIACDHHNISKGAVYQQLHKDIQIGETKSDVMKYLDALEINGIKADRGEYVRAGYYVTAPDGNTVEVEGTIGVMFRDKWGTPDFCQNIGAILYFDKSDKLITCHIDCFK